MVTREQEGRRSVERVQTGVRIERRILLVLKALAASHGMTLGDLVEGVVLHAFEGAAPFGPESMAKIRSLSEVYGLDLDASDSHLLVERKAHVRSPVPQARGKARR
jgi:aryl-alcohol dehydrogenase-like predicted oxidoreductase